MIHPVAVNGLEQAYALYLAHCFCAHVSLAGLVDEHSSFLEEVGDILLVKLVELLSGVVEVGVHNVQVQEVRTQTVEVPVLSDCIRAVHVDSLVDGGVHHVDDVLADILAVKHLVALRIDSHTLLGHNVVEVEDVLSDGEVSALYLLLRGLDSAGKERSLDRLILVEIHGLHELLNSVAAEQSHEVVLKGDVETALARVALTTCTAAELIVDTA